MAQLKRAFTLVELLVVIGIIVVLIGLTMPAVARAHVQALRVKCAANLRSIGHAMAMYTQQYGCYPASAMYEGGGSYAIWPTRLRQFLGGSEGAFYCPALDDRFEWRRDGPVGSSSGRTATDVHARFGYELGEPLLDGSIPFS
jgi:prepilin-type N-terminal cleavage/methylation domain-containing protein